MPQIPHASEWEVQNQWSVMEDFYENSRALGPSCLAKGVISFSELHGILAPSIADYSDDECVELFLQTKMTRPELELSALGYLLVELVGKDAFTRETELDLDRLVSKLHEIGGVDALRQMWVDRGSPQIGAIGSADSVSRGQ